MKFHNSIGMAWYRSFYGGHRCQLQKHSYYKTRFEICQQKIDKTWIF